MSARDYLGVVIRIVGLGATLYGLYDALYAILEQIGLFPGSHYPASRHALGAAIFVAIGIIVVRTADHVVNFAYKPAWRFPSRDDRDDGHA